MRLTWNPDDDDGLRRLWANGVDLKAIADVLGRTVRAVVHRRARLGLPPRGEAIAAEIERRVVYGTPDSPTPTEAVRAPRPSPEDNPDRSADGQTVSTYAILRTAAVRRSTPGKPPDLAI